LNTACVITLFCDLLVLSIAIFSLLLKDISNGFAAVRYVRMNVIIIIPSCEGDGIVRTE
jgi:hypothetical protein